EEIAGGGFAGQARAADRGGARRLRGLHNPQRICGGLRAGLCRKVPEFAARGSPVARKGKERGKGAGIRAIRKNARARCTAWSAGFARIGPKERLRWLGSSACCNDQDRWISQK